MKIPFWESWRSDAFIATAAFAAFVIVLLLFPNADQLNGVFGFLDIMISLCLFVVSKTHFFKAVEKREADPSTTPYVRTWKAEVTIGMLVVVAGVVLLIACWNIQQSDVGRVSIMFPVILGTFILAGYIFVRANDKRVGRKPE